MFYNKNLLHSEILHFKNQIYRIPTHYIFHSRYLIIITVVILCQNGNSILQLSKHSLNSNSISPQCPFSSNFRMLISQQSSTTPVRPAESINTKTEVFFMRELRNTKIIAVDHGYGNMKTANTVTPTGIKAYETEPLFCIIPYFP